MTTQDPKTALAQALWLHYFNQVAYEKGLITEAQRNQLKNTITQRYNHSLK